jgi:hypothetical protein
MAEWQPAQCVLRLTQGEHWLRMDKIVLGQYVSSRPEANRSITFRLAALTACALIWLCTRYVAQGQGLVRFDNQLVNAPFYDSTGTNRLAGANFLAGLYAGTSTSPSSLALVSSPQVFRTGALAGFWQSINVTAPFFAAGSTIQVQVRVWNAAFATFDDATTAGASFGITPVFSVVINPNPLIPAPLAGLPSIGLVQGFDPVPVGLVPPITLTRGFQFLDDPMKASNGSLTNISGVPVGLNRWFLAKPTTTGMAIFSTEGSQIDTVMGVYSNDIFNNVLVCPDCWNDNQSASSTFSEVRVPVQAGTLYRICLAGKNGAVGGLQLNYCVQSELTINPLPNAHVQLSWPSEADNFVLQTTKTPSVANSWSTLAGVPTVVNNINTLSVNAPDHAFYRLYHSMP